MSFSKETKSELCNAPIFTDEQKTAQVYGMVLFARNSIVRSGAPASAIPPLVPMYLKSLILSLVVCYIIVFIVQPIFVKALMKKFGVPGGAPMGEKPEQ